LPVSQSRFLTELMLQANTFAMQWIAAPDRSLIVKPGQFTVTVTAKGEIRVGSPDANAPVVLVITFDLVKLFTQVDVGVGRMREQQALKPRG
jgi:hypothetical protein